MSRTEHARKPRITHRDLKPAKVSRRNTTSRRVTRRHARIVDPRPSLLVGGRPRPRGWDEEEE